jgi:hypothetical protein
MMPEVIGRIAAGRFITLVNVAKVFFTTSFQGEHKYRLPDSSDGKAR